MLRYYRMTEGMMGKIKRLFGGEVPSDLPPATAEGGDGDKIPPRVEVAAAAEEPEEP
jgi:hypothetical protein